MSVSRAGAGTFVQPLEDETYEVLVGWEVVGTAPDYLSALQMLYDRLPPRRLVEITGRPEKR